jgi:hypothetical protein
MKEEQFISDWREMEQSIKGCDINLNDLFIIYEYYSLGQNPKKSLYDELQDIFANSDPNQVISDIKAFANSYLNEIFNKEDKVLFSFWYIPWNMYWKSILLTTLHAEYKEYQELMIQLRRFYYLYWIAGKTLSQIKQTSFNLIKWVKEHKPINEITDELNKKIESDSIIELATRNLTSEHIASELWIKPLLLLMEYNVTDSSKLSFIELNSEVHLEHILPRQFSKFDEWKHFTKETASKWLNSAGNLTLLGGAKNIEASNNPFSVKMDVYKGKGKYDTKNDKVTAFLITQTIVGDFETDKYGKEWNLNAIYDRWEWFFNETEELLNINLSSVKSSHQPELI